MADGYFPIDGGGVSKKVASFPSGSANDGNITGFVKDGNNYVNTRVGQRISQEVGIVADGVTAQNTRFSTVVGDANIQTLEIFQQGTGTKEILITSVINCGEKTLKFRRGTMIKTTGSGKLTNFYTDADDNFQIFSGTMNVEPTGCTRGHMSVNWFGANNGTSENGAAITKAAQVIIKNQLNPDILYFPDRIYICSTPVFLYNWNVAGSVYDQVYIHLKGRITSNGGSDTNLQFTSACANWFGIGFHNAKGCILDGLTVTGPFDPAYTTQKAFMELSETDYGSGTGCRMTRYTPNTGVSVDFARSTAPPDGGWPSLPAPPEGGSWYRGPAVNSGSTAIIIRHCHITKWAVLVGYSTNGQTQNCDSMVIEHSTLDVCKYAVSYGQDQTKNCTLAYITAWSRIFCFMTNNTHGAQTGAPANISHLSLAANVNRIFKVDTSGRVGFKADNIDAEAFYRIGDVTGAPSSINDCKFAFALADYNYDPVLFPGRIVLGGPDNYGNFLSVEFNNCLFRNLAEPYNKRVYFTAGNVDFNKCRFDRAPIINQNVANKPVHFKGCEVGGNGILGIDRETRGTGMNQLMTSLAYGKFTATIPSTVDGHLTFLYDFDYYDYEERVTLGAFTITVDASLRTGTLTLPTGLATSYVLDVVLRRPYIYDVGGTVTQYDNPSAYITSAVIGMLESYNNTTGAATIWDIPNNITTGSYYIGICFEKFIKQPFTCDTTAFGTTLDNIEYFFPEINDDVKAISEGIITAVNTGAKTATMASWASVTVSDSVFNFPAGIRVLSSLPPGSGVLSPAVFILKGTLWYTKEVVGTTIEDVVYEFSKSGYLSANGTTRIRQAEWFRRPKLRVNTTSGDLEYRDWGNGSWSTLTP
jgi:hypothetical protein